MFVNTVLLVFLLFFEPFPDTPQPVLSYSESKNTSSLEKSSQYHDYDQYLEKGINAFYQSDWQKANAIFNILQENNKNDFRLYFFEALIPFWQYFFAGEEPEHAERYLVKSEEAIKVGKSHLESVPDDTTAILMIGGLYGYRGLVAASERQYRTAVQSGIGGYTYTRQLMSLDSDYSDALIGQGVFHYMMGTIPREARWLAQVAGLNGDKKSGLKKLEEASGSDARSRTDARMILTYIYHLEERYEDALRVVELLVKEWPDNIIFRYYYARSLELNNKFEEARSSYNQVIDRNHSELEVLQEMSRGQLNEMTE